MLDLDLACRPKVVKSSIGRLSRKKWGAIIFCTVTGQTVNLNNTALHIYDLSVSGERTIEDIAKVVAEGNNISLDVVMKDVVETLRQFWLIGIITWVSKIPFPIDEFNIDTITVHKSTHDDSPKIHNILAKKETFISPTANVMKAKEIRSGIVNNAFCVYELNGTDDCLITTNGKGIKELIACHYSQELPLYELLNSMFVNTVIIVKMDSDFKNVKMFHKFEKCGTLVKEISDGNIDVYYHACG